MRIAHTGADPTVISRARPYRKAALLMSSSHTDCRTSRDSGPQMLITARAEVRSRTMTRPSFGELERIQAMSWAAKTGPGTAYHESSAVRDIVRSHSMPPRSLHSWVY